jgi:hypothetical protein
MEVVMKVQIDKIGYGNVWSFTATSRRAYRRMRHFFKSGSWNSWTLYVEQRYEIGAAKILVEDGFTLARAEDDVAIEIADGHFVLAEKAA